MTYSIRTRRLAVVALAVALIGTVPIIRRTATAEEPPAMAGVALIDATWHVGASAGQYAGEEPGLVGATGVDPHLHSTISRPTYGIETRDSVRALVVQGSNGERHALVTNSLYIPQDLVNRRVAQLVAEKAPNAGITESNLTISVSHSHTSAYYSTPSWGAWAFQDVFDIRFFEYIADRMATALAQAASKMVPVRMGAAEVPMDDLKRHSYGPTRADDGTPAGFPQNQNSRYLQVLRFDDISNPAAPKLLATWVVFGLHPEMLDGNDLHSGEYINLFMTILEREVGGTVLHSQEDTGTSEPSRDAVADAPSERWELSHREYNQMRRTARRLADIVKAGVADIVAPAEQRTLATQVIEPESTFPVKVKDLRFAPPPSRIFPTVSSCRMEKTFDGNPGVPIVGLPDCEFPLEGVAEPVVDALPPELQPSVTYETLRAAGVPIPDNVGAPSYTGLQETLQVHMQAIRYGDIAITICPCEQFNDQARNIRSRLNTEAGDFWSGFDWTANPSQPGFVPGANHRNDVLGHCTQQPDTTWRCNAPSDPNQPISDADFRRMKAQIWNDARGWDSPENLLQSESEPADIDKIWGNFTREELHGVMDPPTNAGGRMVVTVGMSNDYWGYIVPFREYQRGDHYRKALTGLGPHSSDFFATRLSRMAAELFGGPEVTLEPKDAAYALEGEVQRLRARALGEAAENYLPLYERLLPNDGGKPRIVQQPRSITRFQAARTTWIGGSNYTDAPDARVERCVEPAGAACNRWEAYGDGRNEVHLHADFPEVGELLDWRLGNFQWRWTAVFEAFSSDIALPDASGVVRRQTPAGRYRFVISGSSRKAGAVKPYEFASQPFDVSPWDGLRAEDVRVDPDGSVSLVVGPGYPYPVAGSNTDDELQYAATGRAPVNYPETWTNSLFGFMQGRHADDVKTYSDGSTEVYCFHCSFQAWADTGVVESVVVTINGVDVAAAWDASTQRWRTATGSASSGAAVTIKPGAIVDNFGETNGA